MYVNFNILNQLGSPSINSNTFANRPAAGQTGRLFVSTDTFEIYRDNGTTWDLIGGPGAGTITGSGTATQVAYFTGAQTIGSSVNLFWDNTNTRLGIGTATPGVRLDIHGTGTLQQLNSTGATNNNYLQFQRAGANVWRIGDTYNGGTNYYSIFNSGLSTNAALFYAATNKGEFTATETIAAGLAIGTQFTYNLTVPNATTFGTPNAITALGMFTNMTLQGNSTVPIGTRQGFDASQRISFTTAGTMTITQGGTVRAFSNISTAWSFAGTQVGTVTHLAGMRIVFPDNIGSAINVTNNYGILINNQTTGLGTVNYTNRWGIYQEGSSDLNYFAANMLLGSTTNSGERLQVTGQALFTGAVTGVGNSSTYTVTAASGVARSKSITSTIVAAANNDVLVGLDMNPTFSSGAFTGVTTYAIRTSNTADVLFQGTLGLYLTGPNAGVWFNTTRTFGYGSRTDGGLSLRTGNSDNKFLIFGATGNILIGGTTDAGFKFEVNGTTRLSGNTNVSGFVSATNYLECRSSIFLRSGGGAGHTTFTTDATNTYYLGTSTVNIVLGYGSNTSFILNNANRTVGIQDNGAGLPATAASAILTLTTTTKGFLPPVMTTAQKNAIAAPANGLVVYDTTLAKLCVFTGVNWETVTSV